MKYAKIKSKLLFVILLGMLIPFTSTQVSASGYRVTVRVSYVALVNDGDGSNWLGCNKGELDVSYQALSGPEYRKNIPDWCSVDSKSLSTSQSASLTYWSINLGTTIYIRLTDKDGSNFDTILRVALTVTSTYNGVVDGTVDWTTGEGGVFPGNPINFGGGTYEALSGRTDKYGFYNGFNVEVYTRANT